MPRLRLYLMTFMLLLCAVAANRVVAQENEPVFTQGKKYIDLNVRSFEKYAKRLERTQKNLLKKLQRKEQRLAQKLLRADSVAYARMKAQPLSFDSISKLAAHPDTTNRSAKALRSGQKGIDSLKGVYQFLDKRAKTITGALNNKEANQVAEIAGYNTHLSNLQNRLAYDQYITNLTSQYANSLQGVTGGKNASVTGIQKELFYAKAKIAEWEKIADEPSRMEEKALEYLQGTRGFDQSLNSALNGGAQSMAGATSASELEAMGFQTKRQVGAQLQQKFGANLSGLQGSLGKDVAKWQGDAQGLQNDLKETRQSLTALRNTARPSFKINPMRGLPFWSRVEKQYGFQAIRATKTLDGTARPALISLSAGLAYRQTPKLSAGIAIAGDLGLGQNWSNLRLTFEGIGARSFLTWEWLYGIGAYAGYERTWKQYAFQENKEAAVPITPSTHSTRNWSESIMLGVTKKYKINSRWNGCLQLLYDVWWQDKGLRSPVVLRIVNFK